jgi:branched-subunit amino acid aminotransferase/4-amino-4-deoxychorismate lyase
MNMQQSMHNRKQRIEARRQSVIDRATAIIKGVAERRIDEYEGWQQVCAIFQSNAGLELPEVKQFVRIEGVDPNSTVSVTQELRRLIFDNAVQFLAQRR